MTPLWNAVPGSSKVVRPTRTLSLQRCLQIGVLTLAMIKPLSASAEFVGGIGSLQANATLWDGRLAEEVSGQIPPDREVALGGALTKNSIDYNVSALAASFSGFDRVGASMQGAMNVSIGSPEDFPYGVAELRVTANFVWQYRYVPDASVYWFTDGVLDGLLADGDTLLYSYGHDVKTAAQPNPIYSKSWGGLITTPGAFSLQFYDVGQPIDSRDVNGEFREVVSMLIQIRKGGLGTSTASFGGATYAIPEPATLLLALTAILPLAAVWRTGNRRFNLLKSSRRSR